MDFSSWTAKYFIENKKKCLEIIKENENLYKIPSLNKSKPENFKNNTLVRFRGYIQDALEPEYFLETYEVLSEGGIVRVEKGLYQDSFNLKPGESVNHDPEHKSLGERRGLFVLTLPGINEWAKEQDEMTQKSQPTLTSPSSKKRNLEDNEPMDVDESKKIATDKKLGTSSTSKPSLLSPEYLLNSPIPSRPSNACLVKIYEDFDEYSINQIVEIVGFLSTEYQNPEPISDEDFENMNMENLAANPPASLIPRIHAIYIKELEHNNPLLYEPKVPESMDTVLLCKDLQNVFTQCLLGDETAAKYLLCHLVSNIYIRSGMDALGKFTLNLSNIPKEVLPNYPKEIYELIEMLLPVSHYHAMSIDSFNTSQFMPKKDYKTNKLVSGLLQLPKHSHLVFDETRLEPGKLNEAGCKAVSSISDIIKSQQLHYDFEFYQVPFETNIPILILSEGKSLLPSDFHVPLNPDTDTVRLIKETIEAGKHFLKPKLNSLRKCLTLLRLKHFAMGTSVTSAIENDYVKLRQERNATVDDLNNLLVISRLIGLIDGKSELDAECWNQAKVLEDERINRVNALKKPRNEQ